ncbi:MAG TPA: hypothetical protein VIL25_02940 [Vicinamibacterales bacterium]
MTPGVETPEIGRDTLDLPETPTLWGRVFPARRSALGLRASSAPALPFILIGMLLGPGALGVLTPGIVTRLDPIVSIALAALGIFVGLGIATAEPGERTRLYGAALVEVLLTIAVVGAGVYALLHSWQLPVAPNPLLFAAVAGICASASAAVRIEGAGHAARASRIADFDDAPLVVLGTIAVAVCGSRPVGSGLAVVAGASLLAGTAGLMLFERARSEAERGAFVAGIVALLGGIGAYTGTSPLAAGAIAALVWAWSPGRADRIIASDFRRLQHPLVALLLVIAGASVQWDLRLLWIAAPLVLLRHIGKVLASIAGARMTGVPPGLAATVLLPPGVLGVAVALNVQQALSTSDLLLVSGVTVATAVSELVSVVLPAAATDEDS